MDSEAKLLPNRKLTSTRTSWEIFCPNGIGLLMVTNDGKWCVSCIGTHTSLLHSWEPSNVGQAIVDRNKESTKRMKKECAKYVMGWPNNIGFFLKNLLCSLKFESLILFFSAWITKYNLHNIGIQARTFLIWKVFNFPTLTILIGIPILTLERSILRGGSHLTCLAKA